VEVTGKSSRTVVAKTVVKLLSTLRGVRHELLVLNLIDLRFQEIFLVFISFPEKLELLAGAILRLAMKQPSAAPIKTSPIEGVVRLRTGEVVFRNLLRAVERVNGRVSVKLASGNRPLVLRGLTAKARLKRPCRP
jgi:hypothetical protein